MKRPFFIELLLSVTKKFSKNRLFGLIHLSFVKFVLLMSTNPLPCNFSIFQVIFFINLGFLLVFYLNFSNYSLSNYCSIEWFHFLHTSYLYIKLFQILPIQIQVFLLLRLIPFYYLLYQILHRKALKSFLHLL